MADHVRQYHWPPKEFERQECLQNAEQVLEAALADVRAGRIRPDHLYVGIREGAWK